MNYSQKATKKKVANRIIISWVIIFLFGIAFGCGIFAIGNAVCRKPENEIIQKYGTYDGKFFTTEISMDWSSGAELGFVPLNVDMDENLQEFIYCLTYGYNIDFPFVMAVIQQESNFNSSIISPTNDYGLMQINSINHEWLSRQFGFTDYLDPYQNTRAGIFILRKLFEKYEDPQKVLMAYNLGESGASRLWDKGVQSTRYSEAIMKAADNFSKQIELRKESLKND